MALDTFTVVFLLNGPGGEPQTEEERAATQDAHLAHLADLHDEGVLIAAGPAARRGVGDARDRGAHVRTPSVRRRSSRTDPAVVSRLVQGEDGAVARAPGRGGVDGRAVPAVGRRSLPAG